MKVFVVSPYYGNNEWGEPESVFTDEGEAENYRSMGDMEVTELELDGHVAAPGT